MTDPLERGYPSIVERIVRLARDLCAIIALVLVSFLMFGLLRAVTAVGDNLERIGTPDPVVTGCPFGETECGG